MKKFTFLFAMMCPFLLAAQNYYEYMRIGDVRDSWYTYPGSIDSILVDVTPCGIYTEISTTFNFSTRGTSFSPTDSLEIQMSFTMPDNADVTDMWLWVGDSAVSAGVYDRWTANQIYEEIVARRVDPAILYKYKYEYWNYYDYGYSPMYLDLYSFRIFPLMTNLPRKAKITYQIPTKNLNSLTPYIEFPQSLIRLSSQNAFSYKVRFWAGSNMSNPRIVQYPGVSFSTVTIPGMGVCSEADLPVNCTHDNNLAISFTNNNTQLQFAGTHESENGNKYYELNIVPNKLFNLNKNKKALFMLDFVDANCNTFTTQQMLSELKNNILANFAANDSFSIMISGMYTQYLSPNWLPADSASVVSTFNNISPTDINTYSNLPTLLMDGISFIQENGGKGNMILIASSNSNGNYQQANDLINDYLQMMQGEEIPIYIADLDDYDNYNEYYYIGGQYFYGNEYLYLNLSQQTIGEYYSLQSTSFSSMMTEIVHKLNGFLSSFDLYVGLDNGYTYGNFNLQNISGVVYLDEPLQRIGKFYGTGNLHVIVSAQDLDGAFYHQDFYINETELLALDSTARKAWASQMIRELEQDNVTNQVISQIINTSKQNRVLSYYTAFLALDPSIGPLPQEENGGTDVTYIIPNKVAANYSVSIFPNPANNNTNLKIDLSKDETIYIKIFNLLGQLVFEKQVEVKSGETTIPIDLNDIGQGSYICKINTMNENISTLKLIIQK